MREDSLQVEPESQTESSELSKFCANMAHGLHAMAQPLTILRSTMSACVQQTLSETDNRRYLQLSSLQVERLCGLFDFMQQLVISRQSDALCMPVDISTLLIPVAQEQKASLGTAGIDFKLVIPDRLEPMMGDMDRTLQALYAVLKIATSVSSPGDTVELTVTPQERSVQLVIQNRRAHGKRLNAAEHLNLLLAEASIRSQKGEYGLTEDPFCVSLTLPSEDHTLQEGQKLV
jgi:signal transduction histidine kinase